MKHFLYVLRSVPAGKRYIGIAVDVAGHLHEHNAKTGRWIGAYQPWVPIATKEHPDRAAASKPERFLKSRAGISARQELVRKSE